MPSRSKRVRALRQHAQKPLSGTSEKPASQGKSVTRRETRGWHNGRRDNSHQAGEALKNARRSWSIMALYLLGLSPERLARRYPPSPDIAKRKRNADASAAQDREEEEEQLCRLEEGRIEGGRNLCPAEKDCKDEHGETHAESLAHHP